MSLKLYRSSTKSIHRETPLSLYVFTRDPKFKAKVFDNTQSGAAVANEVVIHVGSKFTCLD